MFFFVFWWWMELRWVFKKVEKFFSLLSLKSFFSSISHQESHHFAFVDFGGGKNIENAHIRVYRAITDQDEFCPRKRCENTFQNRNNIFRTTTPSSPMNGISTKNFELGPWRILGCGRPEEGGYHISMTPKHFHFTFSPSVKNVSKPGPTAQPVESIIGENTPKISQNQHFQRWKNSKIEPLFAMCAGGSRSFCSNFLPSFFRPIKKVHSQITFPRPKQVYLKKGKELLSYLVI